MSDQETVNLSEVNLDPDSKTDTSTDDSSESQSKTDNAANSNKSSGAGKQELSLQEFIDQTFQSATRGADGKFSFTEEVRKDPRFAAISAEARRRDTQRSLSQATRRLNAMVNQLVENADFTDEQKEALTEAQSQGDHKEYQKLLNKFTKTNKDAITKDLEKAAEEPNNSSDLADLEKAVGIPFSKTPYKEHIPVGLLDQLRGEKISQEKFVRSVLRTLKDANVSVQIPKKALEFISLSKVPGSTTAKEAQVKNTPEYENLVI